MRVRHASGMPETGGNAGNWSVNGHRVAGDRRSAFSAWAKGIGQKLIDETIEPDAVLSGTLKPVAISSVPHKVAIAAEWPIELLTRPEHTAHFLSSGASSQMSISRSALGLTTIRLLGKFSLTDGSASYDWNYSAQ